MTKTELIDNLNSRRELLDESVNGVYDALRQIIKNAGGYLNTANNDGNSDNIYGAIYDPSGAGELVEVYVKALRVRGDYIQCYCDAVSMNTITTFTDEDMQNDEDGWHTLDTASDLLYHYTLLNIVDAIGYGEYMNY